VRDFDDLRHGTIDVLVLKALSWEPMHGYAIAKWVGLRASGELMISDAALYKALHRLEADGAIDSEWGLSDNNRRAKYYSVTARGRKMLQAELAAWRRYSRAVNAVLETA
jgi:PadR family transcriptional regulator PadR